MQQTVSFFKRKPPSWEKVSREGVTTDLEKTNVLLQYPEPSDVSSLRAFLGCTGYYRHFVLNFAEIAAPLYNLEKKGTFFQWTKKCHEPSTR